MMHFAEIDSNNVVVRVIVCDSKDWCESILGGTWVRTYRNTPRKNYAGPGYIYYPDAENFSSPRPYPSWNLNTDTYNWEAPVPRPEGCCEWDEGNATWNLKQYPMALSEEMQEG